MDLIKATGALAVGTFLLALATAVMAWQTKRSTGAAVEAVQLQKREIEVFEKQTKLAQDQFEASRSAARPLLDISIAGFDGGAKPSGYVDYVGGSEPAHDVEIWIKARTGFWGTRCRTYFPLSHGTPLFWKPSSLTKCSAGNRSPSSPKRPVFWKVSSSRE